jgi:hypothetical protein
MIYIFYVKSYCYMVQQHSKKAVEGIFLAVGKYKRIKHTHKYAKSQRIKRGRSILTKLVSNGKFGMNIIYIYIYMYIQLITCNLFLNIISPNICICRRI